MNSLVAEKVGAGGHQEGAKLPFLRRDGGKGAPFDDNGEETLRQVGRSIRVIPLAADERVNRMPVRLAELRERLARLRRAGSLACSTRIQIVEGNSSAGDVLRDAAREGLRSPNRPREASSDAAIEGRSERDSSSWHARSLCRAG